MEDLLAEEEKETIGDFDKLDFHQSLFLLSVLYRRLIILLKTFCQRNMPGRKETIDYYYQFLLRATEKLLTKKELETLSSLAPYRLFDTFLSDTDSKEEMWGIKGKEFEDFYSELNKLTFESGIKEYYLPGEISLILEVVDKPIFSNINKTFSEQKALNTTVIHNAIRKGLDYIKYKPNNSANSLIEKKGTKIKTSIIKHKTLEFIGDQIYNLERTQNSVGNFLRSCGVSNNLIFFGFDSPIAHDIYNVLNKLSLSDQKEDFEALSRILGELCSPTSYQSDNEAANSILKELNERLQYDGYQIVNYRLVRIRQTEEVNGEIKLNNNQEEFLTLQFPDVEIIINNKYRLSKLRIGETNHEFFKYIFLKPGEKITRDNLPSDIAEYVTGKEFSKVLTSIGFTGEIRKAFFHGVSKDTLIFRGEKINLQTLKPKVNIKQLKKELESLKNLDEELLV